MENIKDVDIDIYVGNQLRNQRYFLGLTQKHVADMIGVKFQQIQKYESGKNKITASRLYELSKVLKVDILYFFSGLNNVGSSLQEQGEDFVFENLDAKPSADARKLLALYNKISSNYAKKKLINFLDSIVKDEV